MNAVNRVWAAVGIYVQAISFLAALFCVFTFGTPQASAANNSLTPDQVGAISNLLTSLNVDQATIQKVQSDLVASPSFAAAAVVTAVSVGGGSGVGTSTPCGLFGFFNCIFTATVTTTLPILIPMPVLPAPTSTKPVVVPLPTPKTPPTLVVPPTCTLTASATTIDRNSPILLTWTSQNAISASTANGKKTGAPAGSITVNPAQDTTYVKHVYGPGGEGSCQVIINVIQDTNRSMNTKMVWNLLPPSLMNTINEMQVGAVVLSEELGLANSSQ